MRRRQLEARRLSESSPIAGLGTYQLMRPARGREVVAPRNPRPRPPRLPNGSDAFGAIGTERLAPRPPVLARAAEQPVVVAPRPDRAEIAPPPPIEARQTGWLLPMTLATAVSTVIIALALWLR